MDILFEFKGSLSWPCGGHFDVRSSCYERILIDLMNICFLLCYFLAMIAHFARGHGRGDGEKDKFFKTVSVLCTATGIAYFADYLWAMFGSSLEIMEGNLLLLLFRGLVWISVAVSLNFCHSRWTRILVSAWWFLFSLSMIMLDLKIIVEQHSLEALEAISWPVNLILLLCVYKVACHVPHQDGMDDMLTQPLLPGDVQKSTGFNKASFLSKVTFSWLNPLLSLGQYKPLEINDIPDLCEEDKASSVYQKFAEAWELQMKVGLNTKNVALIALVRCYKKEIVLVAVFALLRTISLVSQPVILYKFVEFSNQTDQDISQGLMMVAWLAFAKIVESLSQRHWFFYSRRCGLKMRSALMAAVFQKQLKLSSFGRRNHSSGEITNYIAVDAYRLGEFPWWFHMAWSCPLQLVLTLWVLLEIGGKGAAIGLFPLILCGSLNVPFAKFMQKCQSQFMAAQDERLRTTSESLSSMKIIKLQSWEDNFRKMIHSLRDVEFKWLKAIQMAKACGTGIFWISPTIVSAVVFTGFAITGSAALNASTIFAVLASLRTMSEPVRMIPDILSMMIQVKVSLNRLDAFLMEDEMKEDNRKQVNHLSSTGMINIKMGTFSWENDVSNPALKDINLEIKKGQKIGICGAVGSGKSSLLSAILGEIPTLTGMVDVYGSIAYVSQTSWIQSGTICDNILFGKPMDKKRYEMAIKACALDKDIENFDHGDLTEIGQRGLNMSGGQKQRIQLARAVYNDADIYLLDDPFSAVDADTAATLFNDCVRAALAVKTVILVTHQVEFLSKMDKLLVMSEGEILQSGTYEEILRSGTEFERLVDAHRAAIAMVDHTYQEIDEEAQETTINQSHLNSQGSEKQEIEEMPAKDTPVIQLTKDEEMEIGYGGWKPYLDYINIPNNAFILFLTAICQILFVVLQMVATFWLAMAMEIPNMHKDILIGTYTIISAISCLFACLRAFLIAHLGLKASKALFSGLMDSLFRAPMLFFDSTPVGRILTRATSDMSILDFDIPLSIGFSLAGGIELLAVILVMAIVTWQVLIVAIPVLIATRLAQRYYLTSARELVRINGTTKAPVMNYAAEATSGGITIRAFRETGRFVKNNYKLIDTDATLFFHTIAAMEWILIRVEILQNITIFTASLLLVLLPNDDMAQGFIGLSLSYALTLTSTQVFFTRWYTLADNNIISVERIRQFTQIPSEAPSIIHDSRPPSLWPYNGRIDLQNLQIRYRPNAPLVLKGITCTFMAGEKIGIVGRTGSGKTTLISALFRLTEPTGGRILIDNLDICSIGIKDLRMKLGIIPQEPTLFKGSVRRNLDPLCQYTDHNIWEALEKCQLKTTIIKLPNLLDSFVSDEGHNWSVGQRQLFCLGRILLRRNKILILDEATASIDTAMDATLQKIIREEFSCCTVLTVAHRVPTVMDSDKVMVLSYGNLVEYDTPLNLIGTTTSFSKLVTEYWSNCKKTPS